VRQSGISNGCISGKTLYSHVSLMVTYLCFSLRGLQLQSVVLVAYGRLLSNKSQLDKDMQGLPLWKGV